MSLDPLQFVAVALAGWLNQQQQEVIDYLREENKVLREQLGDRRLRLNDNQRRRLAVPTRLFLSKPLRTRPGEFLDTTRQAKLRRVVIMIRHREPGTRKELPARHTYCQASAAPASGLGIGRGA